MTDLSAEFKALANYPPKNQKATVRGFFPRPVARILNLKNRAVQARQATPTPIITTTT